MNMIYIILQLRFVSNKTCMSGRKFKEMAQGTEHSFWKKNCWGRVGIVGWRNWEVIAFKTFCCTARAQEQKRNYSSRTKNEWFIFSVEWVWDEISSWGVKCSDIVIIIFICFVVKFQNIGKYLWKEKKITFTFSKEKKKIHNGSWVLNMCIWYLSQRKN